MAVYRRGKVWWIEFVLAGQRIRESTKTTRKTIAKEYERRRRIELEKALAGIPSEQRGRRLQSVSEVVRRYLEAYPANHRPKSVAWVHERLAHVLRLLGRDLVPDLTEDRVKRYMQARQKEGVSGRTINMELAELSRAVGRTWRALWPSVRRLEENHDVGRALSHEEERSILEAAAQSDSPIVGTVIRIALLTVMRIGEVLGLRWRQVDLEKRIITVQKAKSTGGTGRTIPLSHELFLLISAHADWFRGRFGDPKPEHYVFPSMRAKPPDPTRPTKTIKKAWRTVLERAGVQCRFHDLRHTAVTKMAEKGVPESTMLAIVGHLSRAMLERYSHIRMEAKRRAVEALSLEGSEREGEPAVAGVPTKVPTPAQPGRLQ